MIWHLHLLEGGFMNNIINLYWPNKAFKFEWKDRDNNFYYVENMTTSHLFFTLRMIWNHTMPEEAKLRPYIKYRFGSYYKEKYMLDAVINIFHELEKRHDLKPKWKADLQNMYDYISLTKYEQRRID